MEKRQRTNLHLRDLPGRWYSNEHPIPRRFPVFADEWMIPDLGFKGYPTKRAEKRGIAIRCLHQLIGAGLNTDCIKDIRNTGVPGVRLRLQVWDAIVAAGFAVKCVGSELSGKTTRYGATEKLLTLQRVWRLYLTTPLKLARNSKRSNPTKHALVSIHTGKVDLATGRLLRPGDQKQLVPIESTGPQTEIIKVTEDILEQFNRNNVGRWKAISADGHAFQPNPCLRQVFAGGWLRLGRFYTFGVVGAQSVPTKVRRRMRADGKRVAELDLEGSLLRMIYHKRGIDPDQNQDIYRPDLAFAKTYALTNLSDQKKKIIRNFVKKATIICLNAKSRQAAHSSVGKLLAISAQRDFLHNAIYRVENCSPKGVVRRLLKLHEPIASQFFAEVGVWMMTCEAQVMEGVMLRFTLAGKPALLIHDAIVVKRCDVEFAKNALTRSYRMETGFDPVIKHAY